MEGTDLGYTFQKMPRIESYEFGRIRIDSYEYRNDVIIFPDHVKAEWWRQSGHLLQPEDLTEVVEFKPKLLIIGTGASGCMQVSEETRRFLEERGIQLKIEKTGDACQFYNETEEKEGIVAALHLTC